MGHIFTTSMAENFRESFEAAMAEDAAIEAAKARDKLKRLESSIVARLARAPAARAYLATLLEIIRD